jgi:hypothetical protein
MDTNQTDFETSEKAWKDSHTDSSKDGIKPTKDSSILQLRIGYITVYKVRLIGLVLLLASY